MVPHRKPKAFVVPQQFRKLPKKQQKKKGAAFIKKGKVDYTEDGFVVTTLYLGSLARQLNREDLLQHFSEYGNVQNIRIHEKATHSFAFVTFELPQMASKALAIRYHIIAGHRTAVSIADSWHRNMPLQLRNNHEDAASSGNSIETTNVTGTHLLDLNDDCLYEVFSLKYVRLMDLCSIAETCTRLKQIANRIFSVSHKSCHLNKLSLSTIHEVRRFLLNFGQLISEIWLEPPFLLQSKWQRSERVIDLVTRHCGKTLESLILSDYRISSNLAIRLKPLFSKLQKLSIRYCVIDGEATELFTNCKSMVELKFENFTNVTDDVGMIFENTFPKLERFKYKEHYNDYDDYNLDVFVSRYKGLKTFNITGFDDDPTSLLSMITKNCKQLEKLQIVGRHQGPMNTVEYKNALNSILSLEKLKKLKINCCQQNVTKFAKELHTLKSLELLELWHARADAELILPLSQLKHIHALRLHYCGELKKLNPLGDLEQLTELSIRILGESHKNDIDVIQLIKRLTNLKTLIIEWDKLELDKKMYLRIVDIVRERPGMRTTTLEIKCDTIEDDVADLQFDGNNHLIVKLDNCDTLNDYVDYTDDDSDDDDFDDHLLNPFLLPMLDPRWLFGGFHPSDSSDEDDDDDFDG